MASSKVNQDNVTPADIIKFIKNSLKHHRKCFYLISILTARNKLNHAEECYTINKDSSREKQQCSGGSDCFLHEYQELFGLVIMTLIVEKIDVPTFFEVRDHEYHTVQNCEVIAMFLRYMYDKYRNVKENRLNDVAMGWSNKLYEKYKENYSDLGYVSLEHVPSANEVKMILPRGTPVSVSPGKKFSDIVKGTKEEVSTDLTDIIADDFFPNFDELLENIESLRKENDEYRDQLAAAADTKSLLEKRIEELNAVTAELKKKLDSAITQNNKYRVTLEVIKKNVSFKK